MELHTNYCNMDTVEAQYLNIFCLSYVFHCGASNACFVREENPREYGLKMRQFIYIFTIPPCFAGTATPTTGMWMTYTLPGGAASGAAAAVARAAVAAAVISAAGAASTDQRTGRAAGHTLTGRICPPDSPKISAS
jgi:hypothetical protein